MWTLYCCQSLVDPTAFLSAELEPNLLPSALYGVFRLLPDLCKVPLGPEPEGVRVLKWGNINQMSTKSLSWAVSSLAVSDWSALRSPG